MIKAWLSAFRLRTLPLALSSIGMGSILAATKDAYIGVIFFLCASTTIFLQILSNLANDYGDSVHGADSLEREGPARAVQSGQISALAMYRAMVVFTILSLASGITLLYFAINSWFTFFIFLGLGLLAILAAITYTAGKRPYGYAGLGDISVFIFFGLVGVMGTFYLHTHRLDWLALLPAASCGLFSVAVLNVNNIRDIASDRMAGKLSIPVRIGRENAVIYHWFLLMGGILCSFIYVSLHFRHGLQFVFLLVLPLLIRNGLAVSNKKLAQDLDPYLKQMAITTMLFVILFGIGNLFLA